LTPVTNQKSRINPKVIGVLRHHAVHSLVGLRRRQLGNDLQREGGGDQWWSPDKGTDETVIVTAAVTEALAVTGESHARHQHEIELRGRNQGAEIRARLPDAPHAGDELPRRVANLVELEHPAIALDPGQHQRFAPRERIVYEAPGFAMRSLRDLRSATPN
jgi:hypothetical protein